MSPLKKDHGYRLPPQRDKEYSITVHNNPLQNYNEDNVYFNQIEEEEDVEEEPHER